MIQSPAYHTETNESRLIIEDDDDNESRRLSPADFLYLATRMPGIAWVCERPGCLTVRDAPSKVEAKPKPVRAPDPNNLLTKSEAATRLYCSIKTLDAHVASGALRYVAIGRGSKRSRKMFTPADLGAFIEAQTRKDSPCLSSATRVRPIGGSTFRSEVIAFSARRNARPGGKRKP